MKYLRVSARVDDRDNIESVLRSVQGVTDWHRRGVSLRRGGASPIYYQSLDGSKVRVFPDWWTEADLRGYSARMNPIVLELEDEVHDQIIARIHSRPVLDTTTPVELP